LNTRTQRESRTESGFPPFPPVRKTFICVNLRQSAGNSGFGCGWPRCVVWLVNARIFALPFHSVPPSQIAEDGQFTIQNSLFTIARFRASGPCRNSRPHDAPKFSPASAAPGNCRIIACLPSQIG
jgi:hypothetical protein